MDGEHKNDSTSNQLTPELVEVLQHEFGEERVGAILRLDSGRGTYSDAKVLAKRIDPLDEARGVFLAGANTGERNKWHDIEKYAYARAGELSVVRALFPAIFKGEAFGLKSATSWEDRLAAMWSVPANEALSMDDIMTTCLDVLKQMPGGLDSQALEKVVMGAELFELSAEASQRIRADTMPEDHYALIVRDTHNLLGHAELLYLRAAELAMRQVKIPEDEQTRNYLTGLKAFTHYTGTWFTKLALSAHDPTVQAEGREWRKTTLRELIDYIEELFVNRGLLGPNSAKIDTKGPLQEAMNILESYLLILRDGKENERLVVTSITGRDRSEVRHPERNWDAMRVDLTNTAKTFHQYKNKKDNHKARNALAKYHPRIAGQAEEYTPTESELREKLDVYRRVLASDFKLDPTDADIARLAMGISRDIVD